MCPFEVCLAMLHTDEPSADQSDLGWPFSDYDSVHRGRAEAPSVL